jgi:hypothetical protein
MGQMRNSYKNIESLKGKDMGRPGYRQKDNVKINLRILIFQILVVAIMKITIFWDILPCSLVDVLTSVSEVLSAAIIRIMSHSSP